LRGGFVSVASKGLNDTEGSREFRQGEGIPGWRCGTERGDFYTEITEGTEFTERAVTLGKAVKKSSGRKNERAAEGCRS